jgi:hypothetical protein
VAAAAERHGADRAHGVDPKGFVESIRREVLAVDAEQPIYDVSAMVDVVSRSVFLPRVSMLLLGAFAISALLLAVVGIYGVVSYTVTSGRASSASAWRSARTRRAHFGSCSGRSMMLIGAGTVCGLVASVGVTRVMAGSALRREPARSVVFAGVSLTLATAGFVASLIPARRATRWIRSSRCACRNRDPRNRIAHAVSDLRARCTVHDEARTAVGPRGRLQRDQSG